MPEIKHNFAGGKMNKDLDERLVPNGEYRDAMNIQVRTTSGEGDGIGDAGTVQNIEGTQEIFSKVYHETPYTRDELNKMSLVGSVANEKNNKAYFFIAGLDIDRLESGGKVNSIKKCIDTIIEVDTGTGMKSPIVKPVFVDKHAIITPGGKGNFETEQPTTDVFNLEFGEDIVSELKPGMVLRAYRTPDNVEDNNSSLNFSSAYLMNSPIFRATIHSIDGTVVRFKERGSLADDMSTGQQYTWSSVVMFTFKSERVLNFRRSRHINAINIIDDLLFWTDGVDEPKRINIRKSIEGSEIVNQGYKFWTEHTDLRLEDPDDEDILEAYTSTEAGDQVQEVSLTPDINNLTKKEHITVIRKSPRTAPVVEMSSTTRDGETVVTGIIKNFLDDSQFFGPGDTITFADVTLAGLDWAINDILIFTEEIADVEERGVIRATIDSYVPTQNSGSITITILSVNTSYINDTSVTGNGIWTISLEEKDPLFELKLGRFGYRYKYDNGEYSTFSPWSRLAFLPGRFDYNHKKGYNLGMVNTVRKLKIKNFIPHQRVRPADVVAVDILWKTTESPNVYIVKTVSRGKDLEWTKFSNDSPEYDGFSDALNDDTWVFGELSITSEMIHKVVEKNQLLRAWDNVPRYALAQEIAANRVVFGNYTQGYEIKSRPGLEQNLKSYTDAAPDSPKRSVKSIRSYKFGMVFGDKYGRETPVIPAAYTLDKDGEIEVTTGDVSVSKQFAAMRNTFELTQHWSGSSTYDLSPPEQWMDYVKYYVKETSNEYYNLIMDKWYEAEDGNIWISFPSADRNKVDEETYLTLKKSHGSQEGVIQKARYKIIAIKNEPPDFIKIEPRIMGMKKIQPEDFAPDSETGEFGVFSDTSSPNTVTTAPDLLMTGTSIKMGAFGWNMFLKDYKPKGDLQIRVVGKAVGGLLSDSERVKYGWEWKTITYQGTGSLNDQNQGPGILRWNEPFGNSADMTLRFNDPNITEIKYYLEFREAVVVTTQAEFDGKFFVKIEKDDVLEGEVLNYTGGGGNFYTTAEYNLMYIDSVENHPSASNIDANGVELHPRNSTSYSWFDPDVTGNSNTLPGGSNNIGNQNVMNLSDSVVPGWNGDDPINNNSNDPGILSGSSTPTISQAGAFLALGCNQNSISNFGGDQNTYIENAMGFDGYNMVNWGAKTQYFWNWIKSEAEPALSTRLFLDSARLVNGKMTGGIQDQFTDEEKSYSNIDNGLDGNNDIVESGLRNWRYYKPTGLDQGYSTDSGAQPTVNGELGRIFVSTFNVFEWGWIGDELSFKNSMTQPGGKFRFPNDPNDNIYQIISTSHEELEQDTAKNYPGGNQFFGGALNDDWTNETNLDNLGFTFYNQTPTNLANHTSLAEAQGTSDPTLVNIIFGGNMEWSQTDTNTCGDCDDTANCRRSGFRVEFRLFDPDTGQLADNGDRGIDTNVWDPRGQVCHDGRESFSIAMVSSQVPFTSIAQPPTQDAGVFETEPKEDVGLDLYYEASNAIPMTLSEDNAINFIPYDSKVTLKTGVLEEGLTSVNWASGIDHRVYYLGHMTNYIVVGVKYLSSSEVSSYTRYTVDDTNTNPMQSNPKWLVFEHPDGTKTTSIIRGKARPADENGSVVPVGQIDNTISNSTQTRFARTNSTSQYGFFLIEKEVNNFPIELSWHNCWSFGNGVESDRIRDDFNAPQLDNGVKVSTTYTQYGQEHKGSGLIYSGIYNSLSGVNNLNEFNQAEKITKDLNPSYGSIQALKTRDTDIVVFTEDKLLKVITNKDALYNADGNAQLTATNRVLGTAVPFAGDYGISNNPESLAWDQYRLYFTDMQRGAVLRLSGNGLTPISNVGMKSWFRENLRKTTSLLGTFDTVNGEYNLTMQFASDAQEKKPKTISFNEASKGWVSFKSFIPETGVSIGGKYITGKQLSPDRPIGVQLANTGSVQTSFTVWEHHVDIKNDNPASLNFGKIANRNTFYAPTEFILTSPQPEELDAYFTESSIDVLFNDMPGSVKSFTNVNYEGSQGLVKQFVEETTLDPAGNTVVLTDKEYYNLSSKNGWWVDEIITDQSEKGSVHEFIGKEGKWFNRIDGSQRGDITSKDISEFSVQGIGYLAGTLESTGTTYTYTVNEVEGNDGANFILIDSTITVEDDGETTTETTTEVTHTTDEETGEVTQTTPTTTETSDSDEIYVGTLTPEGFLGQDIDWDIDE